MKKLFLLLMIGAALITTSVYAVDTPTLLPGNVTTTSGATICDAIDTVLNIAKLFLTGISSASLLMFVIGGFVLITSEGNEQRVEKGKKIITGAIIGTLIIAFSWVGVNGIIAILTNSDITEIGDETYIFQKPVAVVDEDGKATGETISYKTKWWDIECTKATVSECSAGVIGSPCTNCEANNGASGDTNCYCHIPNTTEGYKKLEEKGSCLNDSGENICSCMSLCSKVARDYTQYANYQCVSKTNPEFKLFDGGFQINSCLSGEFCPRKSSEDGTFECCSATGTSQ